MNYSVLPYAEQYTIAKAVENYRALEASGKLECKAAISSGNRTIIPQNEGDEKAEKTKIVLDTEKPSTSKAPKIITRDSNLYCKEGDVEYHLANFSLEAIEHQILIRPDTDDRESKYIIQVRSPL